MTVFQLESVFWVFCLTIYPISPVILHECYGKSKQTGDISWESGWIVKPWDKKVFKVLGLGIMKWMAKISLLKNCQKAVLVPRLWKILHVYFFIKNRPFLSTVRNILFGHFVMKYFSMCISKRTYFEITIYNKWIYWSI